MTEISEDRSWWTDVEHLRPDAEGGVATRSARGTAVADREPVDREPAARERDDRSEREDRTDREPEDRDTDPPVRRGRITGRPLPEQTEKPAVLCRSDAAFLADAMDLDGAFGAPVRRAESREIVLSGRSAARAHEGEAPARRPSPSRPAVRGEGSPDRETVHITGSPGVHAAVAERRALRELESRRPRSAAERIGHRPDRVAMWTVMLGLLLVIIAASSSSGVS